MYKFAQLLVEAELTGSVETRQALLENFFSEENDNDVCWAIYLLSDKQRARYLKSEELRSHFLDYSKMPEWLFDASNNHVNDVAECISLILKPDNSKKQSTSLNNLLQTQLPTFKKLKSLEEKKVQLKVWWDELSGDEIYVLNKLLTGGFRGASLKPLLIPALATVLEKSETELTYKLSGKYAPSAEFYEALKTSDSNPSEPYQLQQAVPWTDQNLNFDELHFEWKYDGIRAQLIKRNDEVFLWSKNQDLLNEQFPDIIKVGQKLDNGTVLDGEIVGCKDGQITMMNGLRVRLERKKPTKQLLKDLPVRYIAFDVLEHKATSLQTHPFEDRRQILITLKLPTVICLAKELNMRSANKLEQLIKTARPNNADGIIIRNKLTSNYWSYQAPPYTLLAVLTYVQGNIYSFSLNQSGELITFTKVENHLTTKKELDGWVKQNSLERFGPVTSVKAQQIFEIEFDSIFESKRHKSGLSLKNPKIVKWRQDLTLVDIDTLEIAKSLVS